MKLARINSVIRSNVKGHSSLILSVGAGIGTIATAYLVAKASFKAAERIQTDILEQKSKNPDETAFSYLQRQRKTCLEALYSAGNLYGFHDRFDCRSEQSWNTEGTCSASCSNVLHKRNLLNTKKK